MEVKLSLLSEHHAKLARPRQSPEPCRKVSGWLRVAAVGLQRRWITNLQPYALMQPSQTLGPRGGGNMSHTGILEQCAFRVTRSPALNDVNRMFIKHISMETQFSRVER